MKDANGRRYRFDDVVVDSENLQITVGSELRPLEPRSFRLLLFLIENPGRVLSKEKIMAVVWPDAFVSDNSLARAITQIRKALGDDPKAPRYIETVPTVGYRFVGDCVLETEPNLLPPDAQTSVSPAPSTALVSNPRRARWWLTLAACLVVAAALGAWRLLVNRESKVPYPLRVVSVSKLTSYPGDERQPALSPDGSTVAFSWSGAAADNYDIYLVKLGGQQPLRLTRDPATDSYPAWSPDGSQLAFLRRHGASAEIVVVSPLGGPERVLHTFARIGADLDFTQHPVLTWSGDGKSIVYSGQSGSGDEFRLSVLSTETGELRAISSPEAGVVGDSSPALSSDGTFLAFVRYLAPRNGRMMIQPLASGISPKGDATEVKTNAQALHSPAWLEDGRDLIFADEGHIFQWDRDKGTVTIYAADGTLGGMSLGPVRGETRRLVVAIERKDPDLWDIALNAGGTQAAGPPTLLQRSTEQELHPDYSPDGRRIAFTSDRSGAQEIWIADADGSNPWQLTHLGAHVASYPRWSPDGKRIAFHARVPEVAEVYVVDVNQGVPRMVTHENPGLALATWSHDGRFLYASTLVGGRGTTYRFPVNGGPLERLWEGALVKETLDGKYVIYWKTNAPGIFRRSLEGDLSHNPEELLVPDFWPNNQIGGFAPVASGIYYVSWNAQGKPGPFRYFDYATHKSTDVAPAVPGLSHGFAISPDRRHLAFAASTEIGGDLVSLELR